jgi:S-sulfo-L-cysteine synthase (3-phospho-L-serine-dependent)
MHQGYGAAVDDVIRDGFQDALPYVLSPQQNLHILAFQSMKLLPALACINDLEKRGLLRPNGVIADTSSGSFAYGMARVAVVRKYRCIIVTDSAVNGDFLRSLESLGAEVIVVEGPSDGADLQLKRKKRLGEIVAETKALVLDQYDNPVAAHSYEAAAAIAAKHVGKIDVLVAPIGTGGSSRGLAHYLRLTNPELRLVVVDTFSSTLFGLKIGRRRLRGVGNSFLPGNVAYQAIDDVHFVSAEVAYEGTLRIAETGLGDYGPTSGAAFMVASTLSLEKPDNTIMCVFPDQQFRYTDIIAEYRQQRASILATIPRTPTDAIRLADIVEERQWVSFKWRRRSREDVLARGC